MKCDFLSVNLLRFKDKVLNFINKNIITILVFLIILILLVIQHSVISLYFDDYGNASLSYSYVVPDMIGTNFNLSQLFEWAYHIYQNWGRKNFICRVFYYPIIKKWDNSIHDGSISCYIWDFLFYI